MSHLFPIDSLVVGFWSPGPAEMMVLAMVALLLYGGKLPDVARSWGKTLAEFRRSLSGIQSEINDVIYSEPDQLEYRDDTYRSESYQESEFKPKADSDQDFDGEKTVADASKETVVIDESESEEKPVE